MQTPTASYVNTMVGEILKGMDQSDPGEDGYINSRVRLYCAHIFIVKLNSLSKNKYLNETLFHLSRLSLIVFLACILTLEIV